MKRNIVEWAVLAVSVLAIVVLVAVLLAEGLDGTRPADPQVTLRRSEARVASSGWIVPADIYNNGDAAAEAVVLEASATVDGELETSEIVVAFLPPATTVQVAFAFSGEPDGEIALRLVGYLEP